jgi:tetratricopeptide (TPR) repeat protein
VPSADVDTRSLAYAVPVHWRCSAAKVREYKVGEVAGVVADDRREPPFGGSSRVLLVEGLVAIFDQVKESREPVWVSLEAPAGWGKTRVAQEFFKRISAERQSSPGYWPPSILGATVTDGEVEGPEDRRKRVFPESFDRWAGAGMDWFWWGISCSLRRGRTASQALVEDLVQLEQHSAGLERAFHAEASRSAKVRESLRRSVGAGVEAGGGDAVGAALSAAGASVPILGLVAFLGKWAGGAAKRHVERERDLAAVMRIDATGADRGDVVDDTALQIGRLAREGLPVVVFVEDLHFADPGLLDLLSRLMAVAGSVMVVTTCWPGELAKADGSDENPLLRSCPPERRVRVVLETVSDPTGLVPTDAGLDVLEHDALAGVVLHAFPSTTSDVVGVLCEKYRSPLALELVCSLGRIRRSAANGALNVASSDLAQIPPALKDLYRLMWKELPSWAQDVYALATAEIPELVSQAWGFGDDRFDRRLLSEMFEVGALAAGIKLTASQLEDALSAYAWTRSGEHGLGGFMEPDQLSVAVDHAVNEFGSGAINKFRAVLGQHIVLPDKSGDIPEAAELHRASLLVGLCEAGVIEPNESLLEALLLLGWSSLDTPAGPVDVARIVEFADSLRRSFPADQPQFLEVRNLNAHEHYRAGRLQQALTLYTELLEDQTRLLGSDHPNALTTRNNIAATHHAAGRLEQALALFSELLDDQVRLLGLDHPDTLVTRNNIEATHHAAGRLDDALTRYTELLDDQVRLLGSDHSNALTTRNNIAATHHAAGRLEQALALFSELLDDQVRLLGSDHPNALTTRNHIAATHHAAGRLDDALTRYTELLDDQVRLLGLDHPDTLVTRNNIAATHHAAGRHEQALTRYTELLDDEIRLLGPDHPSTLQTRNEIASAHDESGRPEQALALYVELLDSHVRLLGPDHPDTLVTRNNIAMSHHMAGRLEPALTLYTELLEGQVRILGPDHPYSLTTRNNIAGAHNAAGRHEQALALFSELLDDHLRLLGPDHPDTLTTRHNIAGEHDAAGRCEQALALFSELLDDRTRLLGPKHPDTLITRSHIKAHNVARRTTETGALSRLRLRASDRVDPGSSDSSSSTD